MPKKGKGKGRKAPTKGPAGSRSSGDPPPTPPSAPPGGTPPAGEPFRPAQTMEAAQAFAHSLGVLAVDYAGHLDLANHVNEGLHRLVSHGVRMPSQVAVDSHYFHESGRPQAFMVYVPSTLVGTGRFADAIVINPRYTTRQLVAAIQEPRAVPFYSTRDPHHMVFHEVAHMAYYRHSREAYGMGEQGNQEMTDRFARNRASVEGRVGARALQHYREFVSEVFTMRAAGVRIPRPVLTLYTQLKGPPLPRARRRG